MKQTINFNEFVDGFRGRDDVTKFSYEALEALFEEYEQYEEDSGEELEFDPVAISLDWDEYSDIDEYNDDRLGDDVDLETLKDEYRVLEFDGGFVVEAH